MKKLYVPRVKLEIGEDLYLVVSNIDYIPGDPGKYSGLPEDCYEATGPEVDWKPEDCQLIYRKMKLNEHKELKLTDFPFPCPDGLPEFYLDRIIDECEILLEDK